MVGTNTRIGTVDDYIAAFPEETQEKLKELRRTIKTAAPDAKEKIGYQMPGYSLEGNLVYFAAWRNHIGFYGASNAIRVYKDEVLPYLAEKGTLKFPLDEPLPLKLIGKIVKFRVVENLEKSGIKAGKKGKRPAGTRH